MAALILALPEARLVRLVPHLVSYAIGTLLGAALLRMIPHALTAIPAPAVMVTLLAGLFAFFLLESLLLYRHCHELNCPLHSASGELILIGDAFHNLLDGLVIASAFLTSGPVGMMAGLAVIAHEIPQEVGDFGVLLNSGYGRCKAYVYNMLSSVTTLVGAVGGYFIMSVFRFVTPYVLCVSAASFIYIALADLVPERRQRKSMGEIVLQLALIAGGVFTIIVLTGRLT
ncbi:MAG: ZIP family metal transporter [Spirochaetia bacterium]